MIIKPPLYVVILQILYAFSQEVAQIKNKICRFDFANPSQVNYTTSNEGDQVLTGIAPVDDSNIIVSGYIIPTEDAPSYVFYSSNFSSTSKNWAIETELDGKYS